MSKVLVARLGLFFFACLWCLGLVTLVLLAGPPLVQLAIEEGGKWWGGFMWVWLLVTAVLVTVRIAVGSLSSIGRWERRKKNGS